jgi:hypothetical protein
MKLRLAVLCTVLLSQASVCQDAVVVMYSPRVIGNVLKAIGTGGIGTVNATYDGNLQDRESKIWKVRRNEYLVLRMEPGEHVFAGTNGWTSNPDIDRGLPITLQPGKTYFIRLGNTMSGVYIFQRYKPVFTEVSCEQAMSEITKGKMKPAKKQRVYAPWKKIADLPQCTAVVQAN